MSDTAVVAVVGIALAALVTHAYAGIIGASWVPTRKKDLSRVIAASRGFQGSIIVDLGCGDGTVMRAFAARYPSAQVHGYELSLPLFIAGSFINLFTSFRKNCHISYGNAYAIPLSSVDLVYCFLLPHAMQKLKEKFERELRPGTLVITYSFPLPGWQGEEMREQGELPIYRYIR